jgi:hypothetical protein
MRHGKRLSGIIVIDIARPRPLQSVRSQVRCQRLGTLFDNVDKHRLESRDPLGDVLLAGLPHPGPSDLDVLAVGPHFVVISVIPADTRSSRCLTSLVVASRSIDLRGGRAIIAMAPNPTRVGQELRRKTKTGQVSQAF